MIIPVADPKGRAEARKAHQAHRRRSKQPLRIQGRMVLGKETNPTGGTKREIAPLPQRAAIRDDDEELEVVWFGHRDAPSLMQPTAFSPLIDSTQVRGATIVEPLPDPPEGWDGQS